MMNENYENFKFDKNNNVPFSLQNSRIKEIKFHNKELILKVDSIFGYADNEEKTY